MCELGQVSRAGYYRYLAEEEPEEEDMQVRDAIQRVALEHRRRYGYRRITKELRRRGMVVNHKRVLRLMGEDHLLAIRRRQYVLTTDSRHELKVYLNLAVRMEVTGINQLWVADITYIRLRVEFVYLAVVLDRFSRRAVGWALDRSLGARLAVAALKHAIGRRQPPPGLVHHSDRGVQYASQEYVELMEAQGMVPSMSRPGNPYDNAACESFLKTLKQEEIYCHEYGNLEELWAHVEEFLEVYYNRQRLHSALGYRTPEEFEQAHGAAGAGTPAGAARMSYFEDPEKGRGASGVVKSEAGGEAGSAPPQVEGTGGGGSPAGSAGMAAAWPAACGGGEPIES
jgi:transposase InsO family protein